MRVVVPDTSVMLAAFFPESLSLGGHPFDLSARARPLLLAIRHRRIIAHAPDLLLAEFIKKACALAAGRDRPAPITADEARDVINDFLSLPIIRVPGDQIAAAAADLVLSEQVSPPDSWFLAAAQFVRGELWYSHRHADGIVGLSERLHPGRAFALTEHHFGA